MTLRQHRNLIISLLLWASLGPVAIAEAQEAEPSNSRVELMLLQEDGQLKGFSLSVGQGSYVETQSLASGGRVATGVIASVDPVASAKDEDGFGLYTSDVGTTVGN